MRAASLDSHLFRGRGTVPAHRRGFFILRPTFSTTPYYMGFIVVVVILALLNWLWPLLLK